MLPVAVARSFYDDNAIRCVLPVFADDVMMLSRNGDGANTYTGLESAT